VRPTRPKIILIGGSAGGFDAIMQLLRGLPEGFSVPIIVVLHIPPQKESVLAEAFRGSTRLRTKEAEDKEPIVPGTVYFAPPDYHLLVEADGSLSLSVEEPVNFSRPSIDLLFESAAQALGPCTVAIVLSGSSPDGAQGLKTVVALGGTGVVLEPSQTIFSTMPAAAIKAAGPQHIFSLPEMAAWLAALVATPRRFDECKP
jgi:two-component system chemotaxis response regulator CheB